MGRARCLALAAALLLPLASSDAGAGQVDGRVSLGFEARLADVGPIIVYLEPADGSAASASRGPVPSIHQRNARFTPGFLAVAAGTRVDMPNDDAIFHNVFSYSKGNAFDLGLYPSGDSRSVSFDRPGVVKLYCSIHESMNATVFVAPTPYYAAADARGRFSLRGVPPGRYQLRTWSERLPDTAREITVGGGRGEALEIRIGESSVPAAADPGAR